MFKQFIKAIGASFAAGFAAVAIVSALSCSGGAAQASPSPQIHPALKAAEMACQSVRTVGFDDCTVTDFNPSLDIVSDAARPEALAICDAMARYVSDTYKPLAGKAWAVRVINKQSMTPTCVKRVK